MNRIALKTLNKSVKTIVESIDLDEPVRMTIKPKQENKPEFYVSDVNGNFFCMYRNGYPYWSPMISEARELTEESHFNTLVRWEKGIRELKKEYL
jgi:hypothetical protein